MTGTLRILVATLLLGIAITAPAQAQARTQSAPEANYLLAITQQWGGESPLRDARSIVLAPDDIELRVWGGYGLAGTRGVILRRRHGEWRGFVAVVHRCSIAVPTPVADTASELTVAEFRRRARRACGRPFADTLAAASVFFVDTLELRPIQDSGALERAWNAAKEAGVSQLPPSVKRSWMMDGFGYVVELRTGDAYRASVIDHAQEVEADRQVQAVYAAVAPFLRDRRQERER